MPGANYMGGKRNAAKARSKDSIGKIQKGFFSKRRLDMLSQGLARDRGSHSASGCSGTREPGLPDIGLAHAKQKIDLRQDILGYIPSPTHFSPCTPNTRKSGKHFNQASSTSNSSRSSKVIEALDTSEPLFYRAALDRILAMPDLAGLRGSCARPGMLATSTGYKHTVPDEGREHSPGTRQHKKQKTFSHEDTRFASGSFISRDRWIDTMQEPAMVLGSPNTSHTDVSPSQHSLNRAEQDAVQEEFWSLDVDDDDIGYSDFRAGLDSDNGRFDGEKRTLSSPKKETILSSSHSSNLSSGGYDSSSACVDARLPRITGTLLNDKDTQSYSSVDESPAFDEGIPSEGVTYKFPSNNLFAHKDPWHTIGVILGLSPASQTDTTHNSLESDAVVTKSRVELLDLMSTELCGRRPRRKMSLPPSSPPADYSSPSIHHNADHLSSSLELYDDNPDLLSPRPLASLSLLGPGFHSSSEFGWTGRCSPLATAALTAAHGSPTKVNDNSPASAPAMAHTSYNNVSDIANIYSDSKWQFNCSSSTSNKISLRSSPGSISCARNSKEDGTSSNTQLSSVMTSNACLGLGAPSPPFAGVVTKPSPVRHMHVLKISGGRVGSGFENSTHTLQAPSTGILGEISVILPEPSTLKHTVKSISPRLTEVNGVYQGPCLFPEDSDLDSDEEGF